MRGTYFLKKSSLVLYHCVVVIHSAWIFTWLYNSTTWTQTKRLENKERHKNVACCFEEILETAPYKMAVVRPLTSNLTNHWRWIRHAGYYWKRKDKFSGDIFLWATTQRQCELAIPKHTDQLKTSLADQDTFMECKQMKYIFDIVTPHT